MPINYQYITLLKHKPSRKELKDIIYGMYVGKLDGVEKGVLQTVVEKLQNIIVQSSYKAYLKVENVEIGDRAQKMVDRFDMTSDQFKTLMAQMFVRSLVDNLAVAVIPYTVGQAIGGKMVGRFRNGVEYSPWELFIWIEFCVLLARQLCSRDRRDIWKWPMLRP